MPNRIIHTNKIFILAIILFPFQNLAIPLATSKYDLTCFILLFIVIYYTFKNGKINSNTLYFLNLFFLIQLLVFSTLSITPLYRFISAFFWLGGLILIIFQAPKISFNTLIVSKIILGLCIFTSISILIQFYYLNIDRPKAFFSEPSPAGLVLYSASSALISVLVFIQTSLNFRIKAIFCVTLLIFSALFTMSMHVVTFLIIVILVIFIKFLNLKKRFFLKNIFLISFIVSVLIFFGLTTFQNSHYLSRIDTSNVASNLSLTSWLRGYEQMIASTIKSPIFGHGIGSTGYFKFNSVYSYYLKLADIEDLNLKDGYSLAFRLIIEIGPVLFLMFMVYFIKKIRSFKSSLLNIKELSISNSIPSIFLFVFATSLILGSLIKEPNYASSPLYIGIFLFFSPLFKKLNK